MEEVIVPLIMKNKMAAHPNLFHFFLSIFKFNLNNLRFAMN